MVPNECSRDGDATGTSPGSRRGAVWRIGWRRRITLCLALGVVLTVACAWAGAVLWPRGGLGSEFYSVHQWHQLPGRERVEFSGSARMGDTLPRGTSRPPGAGDTDPSSEFWQAIHVVGTKFELHTEHGWRFGWPMEALYDRESSTYRWDLASTYSSNEDLGPAIVVPEKWTSPIRSQKQPVTLPLGIVRSGFTVDAAFWFTVLMVLACGPALLRRWRRWRRHACLRCGYDLTGNVSGVCPECGAVATRRLRKVREKR